MSRRPSGTVAMDGGFDGLEIGRLTWLGLALAAIGWALMLGEAAVTDILSTKMTRPATFHADLLEIAKCIIASGFGIALIGALQTGFGTLNRFFSAVLMRSNRRDSDTRVTPVVHPVERPSSVEETLEQRPYRKLPDGSVEVETILGTRIFKTMAEAREFI